MNITPAPTDAEAAAIAAAVVALWPEPKPAVTPPVTSSRWRFSGRWWHQQARRR